MLKKNLVRTGFLSQSLLLIVPDAGSIIGNQPLAYKQETIEQRFVINERSTIDTMIVPPADSLNPAFNNELPEEELMAVPQIHLHKNAIRFVNNFMKKENDFLVKMKRKSVAHFTLMDSVFAHYGLPVQLKYLAIVESRLNPKAISKAGAKGMWQFMSETAKEQGLRISAKYDERLNVKKSTVAAAKYLKALYREFDDWLLALAAYNGGPGTVYKAIKKSGSRNFWALQYHLPEETRAHVKRYIGVHYYFEGTGSATTQTKYEAIAYKREMDKYKMALHKSRMSIADSVDEVVLK